MLCALVLCVFTLEGPPEGRIGFACAAAGGKVYVIGGVNHVDEPESAPDVTLVFDPRAADPGDAWKPGPRIGSPHVFAGAAAVGERIYVIGGADEQGAPAATSGVLDTTTGAWLELPPMPTPRSRLAVVALNGDLYAIGGLGPLDGRPNRNLAIVEKFDPETGAWSRCPALLQGRHACAAAVFDGCIYVAGGYVGAGHDATASVEKVDLESGKWVNVAPMTQPRAFHAAAAVGGRLFIFGSRSVGEAGRTYEVFDPATGQWTAGEMPEDRHRSGIAVVGERIWLFGGEGEEGEASPWIRWFEDGAWGP